MQNVTKTTLIRKLNNLKSQFFTLFLTTLLVGCLNNSEIKPQEEISHQLIKPENEPGLMDALTETFSLMSNKSGRVSTLFGEVNLNEVLKRVNQDGQVNYSFSIESSGPTMLNNLVIHKENKGYSAYIVSHKPDVAWLANSFLEWDKFSGRLLVYDLNGKILSDSEMIDGKSKTAKSSSGRTNGCIIIEWRVEVRTPYGTSQYYDTDVQCFGGGGAGSTGGGPGSGGPGSGSPGGGGPGGVSNGGSSGGSDGLGRVGIYDYGYEQSPNKLCGGYVFTNVGEGITTEIVSLAAPAYHHPSRQFIPHLWGSACLTFGIGSGLTDSADASQVFNAAWDLATDDTQTWLNNRSSTPLSVQYSNFLESRLRAHLAELSNGSFAFSTGPCSMSGTVPSLARYCN